MCSAMLITLHCVIATNSISIQIFDQITGLHHTKPGDMTIKCPL